MTKISQDLQVCAEFYLLVKKSKSNLNSVSVDLKSENTRQVNLSLVGMTCASCVSTVERSLNKLPGVRAAVNLAMESAHIIAPKNISDAQLISAVTSAGYSAKAFKGERESFERSNRLGVRVLLTFLFTAPIILISMFHDWHAQIDKNLLQFIDNFNSLLVSNNAAFEIAYPQAPMTTWLLIALSLPVVLIFAWPIHRAAIKNLLNPTMDTLVSLGSIISFVWSIYSTLDFQPNSTMPDIYVEVSSAVIFFVMFGRYLEHRARHKAGSSLAELFKLSVSEVEIKVEDESKIIPIDQLQVSDIFVVKPGDRIATDGQVISGFTTVNNLT